ncbi:hypothetical protein M8J75_008516 [Diaphorina citri]|nr:hypothetical protein M8J75_008516 [Diaphorina citri]KAI5701348.1 hypothetical protein M8J75_008516 [Diaphorina citri]
MARMRYCEIPRDVSCTDSFATLRLCKSKKSSLHSTSLNLDGEEEEYGRRGKGALSSPSHPYDLESPPRAYLPPQTPTTECWRKKKTSVTETLPSYETLKQAPSDDSTCSPAPCSPAPSSTEPGRTKSQSLPCHATLSCLDSSLLSALPEDLASQLTLLDLAVFRQIRPDELTSCAWNTRHKLEVAPSVVAFTRRFNHVSFWAVQEILNCVPIKLRAETLAHFIRVGKKLLELNNFHSLFAIISALQSASVYRLSKTWSQLTKKERLTFEKLAQVFSDENNWQNLREHVESLKLPCIPYLGMFLTDLVYIDMAHPSTGGLEPAQRRAKMNNILRIIAHLQALSLKLEPPTPTAQSTSSSTSKESVSIDQSLGGASVASLGLSPAKPPLRFHAPVSKFVPGHRKCHSLGTKGRSTSLPRNFHVGSLTFGFGFQFIKTQEPRHLLDDSVLEVSSPPTPPSHHVTSLLMSTRPHINPFNRDDSVVLQGCLRRKTLLKEGKRPTVSSWQRYWVQLWASTLVYYPPRSFKGHERVDFKKEPCKMSHVQGCMISPGDTTDVFLFKDPLKYISDQIKLEMRKVPSESTCELFHEELINFIQDSLIQDSIYIFKQKVFNFVREMKKSVNSMDIIQCLPELMHSCQCLYTYHGVMETEDGLRDYFELMSMLVLEYFKSNYRHPKLYGVEKEQRMVYVALTYLYRNVGAVMDLLLKLALWVGNAQVKSYLNLEKLFNLIKLFFLDKIVKNTNYVSVINHVRTILLYRTLKYLEEDVALASDDVEVVLKVDSIIDDFILLHGKDHPDLGYVLPHLERVFPDTKDIMLVDNSNILESIAGFLDFVNQYVHFIDLMGNWNLKCVQSIIANVFN